MESTLICYNILTGKALVIFDKLCCANCGFILLEEDKIAETDTYTCKKCGGTVLPKLPEGYQLTEPFNAVKTNIENLVNAAKNAKQQEKVSIDNVELYDNATETFITENGIEFDADADAILMYNEFLKELEDDPTYESEEWKCSNGFYVKMNAATHTAVTSAIKDKVKNVFKWHKEKLKEISKADTVAKLKAIDTGYSEIA